MKGDHIRFIFTAALGAIIFRFELAALLGFIMLIELYFRRITLKM